jgi:serine/threonine protein kinase
MVNSPVVEGQILAGKYQVQNILGEGSMGVVVAAWHLELEQKVAIKFLQAEAAESSDIAERFRREARAVAKISSQHVVRVLDVGTLPETSTPYMVLEYLEGHDLSDELREQERIPVEQAVLYILQACEALAEAHHAKIVHRDLKPANLFLTMTPDGTPCIKVVDFGVSKLRSETIAEEPALTQETSMLGSPRYMSPEQLLSPTDIDGRTDIWALGVTLYQLLSGTYPFPEKGLTKLCQAIIMSTPKALMEHCPDIPQELNDAVMRCLEKKRDGRWQNTSEFAQALAPFGTRLGLVCVERATRILSQPPRNSMFPPASSKRPQMNEPHPLSQRTPTGMTIPPKPRFPTNTLPLTTKYDVELHAEHVDQVETIISSSRRPSAIPARISSPEIQSTQALTRSLDLSEPPPSHPNSAPKEKRRTYMLFATSFIGTTVVIALLLATTLLRSPAPPSADSATKQNSQSTKLAATGADQPTPSPPNSAVPHETHVSIVPSASASVQAVPTSKQTAKKGPARQTPQPQPPPPKTTTTGFGGRQ